MEKHRIVLKIAGKEYTIVSTDTEEHVRRVGAYVDLRLKETELATRLPSHAASVLTCMNIADELLKAHDENTRLPVEHAFTRCGFGFTGSAIHPPHHTPADSPIVSKLLHCYETYTGVTGAKPLAIGGGTYVHDIPGGVAFGCEVEGFDCVMHGPDEKVQIETLLMSGKIFTQAIIDLCGEE